ncbi:unnamed protein product [Peniophora sp. CBMAI 1063]|nr:unnamed protein product [Peniophora sp. CBMAI 1063]
MTAHLLPAISLVFCACSLIIARFVYCPAKLRPLPSVPLIPTIISFLKGESEDVRTRRLVIPTARRHDAGLVRMWALGEWYVHIVDHKLGRLLMEKRDIYKQPARREMMFWRFTGSQSVFFADGEKWANHSPAVRGVLRNHLPIDTFASLSRKLVSLLGDGGRICWSDYSHRFTLDVVGRAILGHDFQSLDSPHNSLVKRYVDIMADISRPLYIAFPVLESILPRHGLRARVDALRAEFGHLLELKKHQSGDDYVSRLLDLSSMSDIEYLDNIVTMFMAGHDTTAGSLSTVFYYLARHPAFQSRARSEVMEAMGVHGEPSVTLFQNTPFLNACIREALRLNGPSVLTIPRLCDTPITLGNFIIPPQTPIALNLYGVLHNETAWTSVNEYKPDRWLSRCDEEDSAWMPFSTGPRRCPATNFSLYEQRTLLAIVLRDFQWTLPADSAHKEDLRNALSTFALNLPDNLELIFSRISTSVEHAY